MDILHFITIIQFVSFLGRCFWALCLWEKCFNIVAGLEWSVHEESLHRGLSPCRGWRRPGSFGDVSKYLVTLVCFTSLYYIFTMTQYVWLTCVDPHSTHNFCIESLHFSNHFVYESWRQGEAGTDKALVQGACEHPSGRWRPWYMFTTCSHECLELPYFRCG